MTSLFIHLPVRGSSQVVFHPLQPALFKARAFISFSIKKLILNSDRRSWVFKVIRYWMVKISVFPGHGPRY